MPGINIVKGKNYKIKDDATVKVVRYNGNKLIEIQTTNKRPNNLKKSIKKLNKEEYLDMRTGEIKTYNLNCGKNDKGVKRAMKRFGKLLKNNFFGEQNELFITCTCEEPVQDIDEINSYFDKFWGKLQRRYKSLGFAYVIEMQKERESLHIHALIKDMENPTLEIPNNKIMELWGKGFTKTSRISDSERKQHINEEDAIKQMEEDDENEDEAEADAQKEYGIGAVISYMIKSDSKENIPQNKQLYHNSRCFQYPTVEEMKYKEALEKVKDKFFRKSEYTVLIQSEETGRIMNRHKTEIYESE